MKIFRAIFLQNGVVEGRDGEDQITTFITFHKVVPHRY
jgi:hypothetical protein